MQLPFVANVPLGGQLPTLAHVKLEVAVEVKFTAAFDVLQVLGNRAAKALQSASVLV